MWQKLVIFYHYKLLLFFHLSPFHPNIHKKFYSLQAEWVDSEKSLLIMEEPVIYF